MGMKKWEMKVNRVSKKIPVVGKETTCFTLENRDT